MKKIFNVILMAIIGMAISFGFALMLLNCIDAEMEIREESARKHFERFPELRQVMTQYK